MFLLTTHRLIVYYIDVTHFFPKKNSQEYIIISSLRDSQHNTNQYHVIQRPRNSNRKKNIYTQTTHHRKTPLKLTVLITKDNYQKLFKKQRKKKQNGNGKILANHLFW